jgi:hypothetical protein
MTSKISNFDRYKPRDGLNLQQKRGGERLWTPASQAARVLADPESPHHFPSKFSERLP